jgi:NADH:ubiquinone oxidoreductase subunit 4 (subunit M)
MPEPSLPSPPASGVTKALSLVVIALMVVAIIYAAWIAIRNWSHIGV